ncbi:MAG: sensor histidine kinase [Gaiellaceae bacterium]
MSVTASTLRKYWVEIGWAAFAAINFVAMPLAGEWETIPFHFVWVSLTLVYGFRVWRPWPTAGALSAVMLISGGALVGMAARGQVSTAELTEVPLMSAMFVAMVWHARRRQAATEDLHRATERERDFVRDASHELRTPITIARGHTELIRAASGDAQTVADADIVLDELSRLERVAERLLLLAAVEHPNFLRRSLVDVDALLAETERRWRASADRDWQISAGAGGLVPADAERLSYALDALIENAVKFTSDGGTIGIRARHEGEEAVIEVRDDGPGIPAELHDRVFERFARDNGRRGTGLGLPIVKAIAEAHGGAITVDSTFGAGACLRLVLPGFRPPPRAGRRPVSGATPREARA